ncbi:hypothetical protein [Kitasatospora indigofera]|uniref:hypothetical protein n=1 Tax=Kitasatospora indigofera TaxID=67307 RepID=UPI0033A1701D
MTTSVPLSRLHLGRPEPLPGDVVRAPLELLSGPGRSWAAEARWRRVEVRLGGRWRPAVVDRWRLHHGSTNWIALLRWGPGPGERAWVLYEPATVRQAPRSTDAVAGARGARSGVPGTGVRPSGAHREPAGPARRTVSGAGAGPWRGAGWAG